MFSGSETQMTTYIGRLHFASSPFYLILQRPGVLPLETGHSLKLLPTGDEMRKIMFAQNSAAWLKVCCNIIGK